MDAKALAIGGGIIGLVVLIVLWQARKDVIALGSAVGSTVKATATAVNPLNPDNVFSSTVNSVGSAVSGDSSWSLGSWLYDATHSSSP